MMEFVSRAMGVGGGRRRSSRMRRIGSRQPSGGIRSGHLRLHCRRDALLPQTDGRSWPSHPRDHSLRGESPPYTPWLSFPPYPYLYPILTFSTPPSGLALLPILIYLVALISWHLRFDGSWRILFSFQCLLPCPSIYFQPITHHGM